MGKRQKQIRGGQRDASTHKCKCQPAAPDPGGRAGWDRLFVLRFAGRKLSWRVTFWASGREVQRASPSPQPMWPYLPVTQTEANCRAEACRPGWDQGSVCRTSGAQPGIRSKFGPRNSEVRSKQNSRSFASATRTVLEVRDWMNTTFLSWPSF